MYDRRVCLAELLYDMSSEIKDSWWRVNGVEEGFKKVEEDEEVDRTGEVGVGQALNEGEFQGSSVFGPLSGASEFCLGLGRRGVTRHLIRSGHT